MVFNVFLPLQHQGAKIPAVMFLAGLTDNEDSLILKTSAIRFASKLGLALICPDVSPRNTGIEGEDDTHTIGSGAGFYLDATEPKWSKHYRMYSYINQELPQIVSTQFNIDLERLSISGSSMGGHGAFISIFHNPSIYKSCSVFAAGCNPSECISAIPTLKEYLGENLDSIKSYDSTCLLKSAGGRLPIPTLFSQGDSDPLYTSGQLATQAFLDQVHPSTPQSQFQFHLESGYDHSYFFVESFIDQHLEFHAQHLK